LRHGEWPDKGVTDNREPTTENARNAPENRAERAN
jgi:hypothetical protein